MSRPANPHLSSDDFDALLEGIANARVGEHLAACALCHAAVVADRDVVARLESLGRFSPSEQLADRVMAAVILPDPFALHSLGTARRRLFATRRRLAVAASVAVVLVGAMGASIAWTLGNRELLASLGSSLAGEAASWLWVALRGSAANLLEQPWYGQLREMIGSPGRLALASATLSATYLAGLFALRKLMALPRGGSHAHA